jgi:hypothetical protein
VRPRTAAQLLIRGAVLGGVVLGLGGRLAMRGITLLEHRTPIWTVAGSLRVIGFGMAFGLVAAALRVGLGVIPPRLLPRRHGTRAFAVLCLALALVGLTPITRFRLLVFLPVVALFIAAMELVVPHEREGTMG